MSIKLGFTEMVGAALVSLSLASISTAVLADGSEAADRTVPAPTFENSARITNPWLSISKQRHYVLRGRVDGIRVRSEKKLARRTEPFKVGGETIQAAIVEDRGYHDGRLREIALDYYAQATDGTVYYLGEDVDYYDRDGTVVGHHGAFRYPKDTKFLGVAMPANPSPGDRYTTEQVPHQGSDRSHVVSSGSKVEVPAGTFRNALKVKGYVLPDDESEVKLYVRGVGLVSESDPGGRLELTRYGRRINGRSAPTGPQAPENDLGRPPFAGTA